MSTTLSDKFRALLTKATLLETCTDADAYDKLQGEYLALQQESEYYDDALDEEELMLPNWEDLIYSEDGKYGLRASSWTPAVPAIYDGIECDSNLYRVMQNGKLGMIVVDQEVHEIFKVEYDSITNFAQGKFIVVKDKQQYYSLWGRISPTSFDEIRIPVCAGWIHVKKDGYWGYLDGNLEFCSSESDAHEFLIPCDCFGGEWIQVEDIDFRPVMRQDIVDCDAEESKLSASHAHQDEWAAYKSRAQALLPNYEYKVIAHNGKYGAADFLGYAVIPPVYDEIVITEHAVPYIYGKQNGLWAMLHPHDGETIFVSEELPKMVFAENWLIAKVKGKYGIYNSLGGAWMLDPVYDDFQIKERYRCIVTQKGNQYGFFDGEFNIPPVYDGVLLGTHPSFVRVLKNGAVGYLDAAGEWTDDIAKARVFTNCWEL